MPYRTAKPTILMTIEVKEREYVSKVMLARHLCRRGWRVIIGSNVAISAIAPHLDKSVILHKSLHPKSSLLRSIGHTVVALDEEGGPTIPKSFIREFCQMRYEHISERSPDLFLSPNKDFDAEIKKIAGDDGPRTVIVGWPRLDSWRNGATTVFLKEAALLKEKFGNYYLLPSSFGAGSERRFESYIRDSRNDTVRQIREFKYENFKKYVELLAELSEILEDDEQIIVRPHNDESGRDWKKTLRRFPNIRVLRQGDVTPWIVGAKGVMVFGSTTAIQASAMGKATVQYQKGSLAKYTDSPSFDLPVNCSSAEEVYATLLLGDAGKFKEQALSYLEKEQWIKKGVSSAERVSETLEDLKPPIQQRPSIPKRVHVYLALRLLASFGKYSLQNIGLFKGNYRKSNHRTTFGNAPGGFSVKELSEKLLAVGEEPENESGYLVKKPGIHLLSVELRESL